MKQIRRNSIIQCVVLSAVVALTSFLWTGCGTIDKTGVYQGDAALYRSELTISTSYEVIHTFVKWEADNRAALTKYPAIKKAADKMRTGAKHWISTANALHDAYKADPSAPNKTALETSTAILLAALTEATGYMTQAAANP
jgi:hypothetical protein